MMPQMMPMYWMLMTIMTMILLMITINIIYFLTINCLPTHNKSYSFKLHNWIWKW